LDNILFVLMTATRKIALTAALSVSFISCREKLPVDQQTSLTQFNFRLAPGDYFSFDNWKLDIYNRRIPGSYFRNTWTVADTGRTTRGWTRVSLVLDSTYDGANRLMRTDTLYFRFDNGDLYQWGFLKSLIAERETLQIAPQWDRIAAFSLPLGESWALARLDTSIGAPETETVYGRVLPTREYVGPLYINGIERAILAYRIEISKPRLDYTFWLADSPTAFSDAFDNSETLANAAVRELKIMRTRQ
jgi:hypothetical protein